MNEELWASVDRYLTDLVVPPDGAPEEALRAGAAGGLSSINVALNHALVAAPSGDATSRLMTAEGKTTPEHPVASSPVVSPEPRGAVPADFQGGGSRGASE